jgi:endo-1,4-beta-xylanase
MSLAGGVTLLDLARQIPLALGVQLNGRLANRAGSKYVEALRSSFNLGVIDSSVYWRTMEPVRGFPDFTRLDNAIIQFRGPDYNNLSGFRGHPIYYPQTNPTWLLRDNFKASELIGFLVQRITQLVGRYQGIIKEWVVVNEPYHRGARERKTGDILFAELGEDYIDIAFAVARAVDPAAALIYNDTNNHRPGSPGTESTLKRVSRLHEKGLIDGVGLQMHLSALRPPTIAELKETMQDYPVPVHVTELDVNLSGVRGSQEKRLARQAAIFRDVVAACLASGNCHSISVWGIGDRYTWLENILRMQNADATLFDDDLNPKPAYFAICDLLQEQVNRG